MPFLNESLLMYDRREFLIASGQLVSAVMVGGVSAAEPANDLAYSPASELLARCLA